MKIKINGCKLEGEPEELARFMSLEPFKVRPETSSYKEQSSNEKRITLALERISDCLGKLAHKPVFPKIVKGVVNEMKEQNSYAKHMKCKGVTVRGTRCRKHVDFSFGEKSDFCFMHSPHSTYQCLTKGQYYEASN